MVSAVVRRHQNLETEHSVPADPLHDERAFVSHCGGDEDGLIGCHVMIKHGQGAGVHAKRLVAVGNADFGQHTRRAFDDRINGRLYHQRCLSQGCLG